MRQIETRQIEWRKIESRQIKMGQIIDDLIRLFRLTYKRFFIKTN